MDTIRYKYAAIRILLKTELTKRYLLYVPNAFQILQEY